VLLLLLFSHTLLAVPVGHALQPNEPTDAAEEREFLRDAGDQKAPAGAEASADADAWTSQLIEAAGGRAHSVVKATELASADRFCSESAYAEGDTCHGAEHATITENQFGKVMDWAMTEKMIVMNDFCWRRDLYDRGIGTLPDYCGSGRSKRGLMCYDNCRPGYDDTGLSCLIKCPKDYSDRGLLCHFTKNLMPGRGCNKWGKKCKACKDGYEKKNIGSGPFKWKGCIKMNPRGLSGSRLDPTKHTYMKRNRGGPKCKPGSTHSKMEAGLCYKPPRTGYDCLLTACAPKCVEGTHDCGPLACASRSALDGRACAESIINMVVSPLMAMLNFATWGAADKVGDSAKVAKNGDKVDEVGDAVMALVDMKKSGAFKAFEEAGDFDGARGIAHDLTDNVMAAAEAKGGLAGLITQHVEDEVAAKFDPDSDDSATKHNNKVIARGIAGVVAKLIFMATYVDVLQLGVTLADPTGVSDVIFAYAKPPCFHHASLPI